MDMSAVSISKTNFAENSSLVGSAFKRIVSAAKNSKLAIGIVVVVVVALAVIAVIKIIHIVKAKAQAVADKAAQAVKDQAAQAVKDQARESSPALRNALNKAKEKSRTAQGEVDAVKKQLFSDPLSPILKGSLSRLEGEAKTASEKARAAGQAVVANLQAIHKK